jgi:hypothetical protein
MLVLVIIWMTLMDNHHVIKSKRRDCYCLVGNDKWILVTSLVNWRWWNGLCVRILWVNFFYAMIPSWFKVFCKLCWSLFAWCVFCVSSMGLIFFYEYFAHFCFGVFLFTMQLVQGIIFSSMGFQFCCCRLLFFLCHVSCSLFLPILCLILVVFLH